MHDPWFLCRARSLLALWSIAACASAFALPPHRIAEKNGCLGCHAAATRLVGPAYQAVAEKYAGQSDAIAHISESIVKGSSGKWGELEMPPHPTLSKEDVKLLAKWILGGAK